MKICNILFSLVLMLPFGAFAKDHVVPIDMRLSGSIMDVGLFDYEGDLKDLKRFDLNLKGAPGAAEARGVGWGGSPVPYAMLPEGNACVDTSMPVDAAIFEEFQMTMDFKDGSLLFANAASGYVCFAPSVAIGSYTIVGGTGRFEGAGGWIDVTIETHRFNESGHPSLVTSETGVLTGEIVLP